MVKKEVTLENVLALFPPKKKVAWNYVEILEEFGYTEYPLPLDKVEGLFRILDQLVLDKTLWTRQDPACDVEYRRRA